MGTDQSYSDKSFISENTIQVELCKDITLKIAQKTVALFTENYPSVVIVKLGNLLN